jgi:hypothetical protein
VLFSHQLPAIGTGCSDDTAEAIVKTCSSKEGLWDGFGGGLPHTIAALPRKYVGSMFCATCLTADLCVCVCVCLTDCSCYDEAPFWDRFCST